MERLDPNRYLRVLGGEKIGCWGGLRHARCHGKGRSKTNCRPRLHGSGQIFARTKTCSAPPCVYTGRGGGTGRIFERLSVRVWDLEKEGPKLLHLAVQKFVQFRRPV